MRTTVTIDDDLYNKALEYSPKGIQKPELFKLAIETYIRVESARRLAALGDSLPDAKEVPRRRNK